MPTNQQQRYLLFAAHLLFWVVWMSFPLYYNSQWFDFPIAFMRILAPTLVLMTLAYTNIGIFIPFLFRNNKLVGYRIFLVYACLIPVAFLLLQQVFVVVNAWSGLELNLIFEATTTQGETVKLHRSEPKGQLPKFVIFGMVLFALFVSSMYGIAKEFIRKERQAAQLKAINTKNELKLLRSQINPHFLFNALNNLYAIVQLKPKKVGEFVLKLSEMLRYVTYDGQQDKVPLDKEVQYLKNYIYFQQWRDSQWQNIELELQETGLDQLLIEPMLLIPFVENAFKHSYEYEQGMWMKIVLKVQTEDTLYFEIGNNKSTLQTQQKVDDEYMGIGIDNIQKRLELLYPDSHQLTIQQDQNSFWAKLTLTL